MEYPHYNHVEGWLEVGALRFTDYYANTFLQGSGYDTLEIGVHHGKYFLCLEKLTPPANRCIAIDVFDDQHLNVDLSGKGSLETFVHNVNTYAANPNRVEPIKADSFDIDPSTLGRAKYGLVSVDGGHTEQHTINDLTIAQELMAPNGLVILDDILNQDWTGVISGACQFFSSVAANRMVPFAIGFNKLFCCHFSSREAVQAKILSDRRNLRRIKMRANKTTELVGHPVVSLRPI